MSKKKEEPARRLTCVFFRTLMGSEPVRRWLKLDVPAGARKVIGADIMTVQETWPIGKPLVGALKDGLWEVRSTHDKVEYRTLFMLDGSTMVLLHGFEKHSKKAPDSALELGRKRKAETERMK